MLKILSQLYLYIRGPHIHCKMVGASLLSKVNVLNAGMTIRACNSSVQSDLGHEAHLFSLEINIEILRDGKADPKHGSMAFEFHQFW